MSVTPPPTPGPNHQPTPFRPHAPRRQHPANARRLGPSRRRSRLSLDARVRLHVRRDALLVRLTDLDHELVSLTTDRAAILDELDELRERLWPVEPSKKGRRPPAHDESAIAPIAADARPLWGRPLRSFALALLRRHGPTSLRSLHDLIHRYGYCIDSATPVKALGDALGHESDAGRAVRVRRGVYRVAPGFRPRTGRHGGDALPPDPTIPGVGPFDPERVLDSFRRAHRDVPAEVVPAEPPAPEPTDPDIVHDPPAHDHHESWRSVHVPFARRVVTRNPPSLPSDTTSKRCTPDRRPRRASLDTQQEPHHVAVRPVRRVRARRRRLR